MKNLSTVRLHKRTLISVILSVIVYPFIGCNQVYAIANTGDYSAPPPFIANTVKSNVVVALDISGSMKVPAYQDSANGLWSADDKVFGDFSESDTYFGYFKSDSKYNYDITNEFFYEDTSGAWDGNFLNWATMRRMDVVRKVLVGGKVRDRNGESISGYSGDSFVVEAQNEPEDRTFRKSYSGSGALTGGAIPDGSTMLISNGKLSISDGGNATIVQLSENVEIGKVEHNRNISDEDEDEGEDDYNGGANWLRVNFKNTYTSVPRVVVTGLSYFGNGRAHARVKDVDTTGFDVRLEEWEYLNINHSTESITYLVATDGIHTITVDGLAYTVEAGQIKTNKTATDDDFDTEKVSFNANKNPLYAFHDRPLVFAGVSSNESERPVIARISDIQSNGSFFRVSLQNEENYFNSAPHPATENIDWIAMDKVSGISTSFLTATSAAIKSSNADKADSSFSSISFDSTFEDTPILALTSWSNNNDDTVFPRYKKLKTSGFSVFMEEEKSDDNETKHDDENILYLAVQTTPEYKLQILESVEPTGVIQQNSASMRFGVAVYNYDHSISDTSSIYNSNKVHSGTLQPCYPDISKDINDQTNFDICLETHVKAPINNIIQVIEEHPLIWGSTPIGETLYDIKGYFEQKDYNRNGHTQWYDNGTEDSGSNKRNSYEISDAWDPYYYEELGTTSPCAKSYVLHFNDGEPYRDFDGKSSQHPTIANDGSGNYSTNDKLDDLALELRENDCRDTGDKAIDGHQDIVSYYVFAALGESDSNNTSTRRMREAAANGGFEDSDGDNKPTPAHPNNFINYINDNVCVANEWDKNADCNPDTFYFANDGAELVSELNDAFSSIVARSATGGASSVISASRSGEGVVVNAIFEPAALKGGNSVSWTGDVHALFIDNAGQLRQSTDSTLDESSIDAIIDFCSQSIDGVQVVRVKESSSEDDRPTIEEQEACSDAIYTKELADIEYLWSGSSWLTSLTDDQAVTQRAYTATTKGRYIITGQDQNNDGLVQYTEQVSFEAANFPDNYAGLIADDTSTAADIINFIRGKDIDGYRSRLLDGEQRRLGDIIYSTPTIVGRPSENFDLLYNSQSYKAFLTHYQYRRQMVYAGANDGLLHAFNGGWFDADSQVLEKAKGTYTAGETTRAAPGSSISYDLGAEVWAYAPYNTLRHLEYISDPSYGSSSSDHINFVDLKPKIFDAKVFPDDTDHPGGWGTIMVVGMRLGGGEITVDMDLNAGTVNRTLTSSYSFFDITNPDIAPKLLLEFTHPNLGFTTSSPAVISKGTDSEGNGDWYMIIGSGADTDSAGFDAVKSTQNGRLFLLDLKNIVNGSNTVLVNDFGNNGVLTLAESNSFISDIVSVDFGLDNFTTDVVYFGTTAGDADAWTGKLYRINIQSRNGEEQSSVNTWETHVVYDAEKPITAPVSVGIDSQQNRWLYVGTGRYLNTSDNIDQEQYAYYGLKEPRNSNGDFSYTTITDKIANVTTTQVTGNTGELSNPPNISPALSSNTLSSLESRMKIYTGAESLNGWKRNFSDNTINDLSLDGERNFGASTLLGGTLTFTTFDPDAEACVIEGQSLLYALNALTGTAGSPAIINETDANGYNQYVLDLGSSPAATPSLHRGEGYASKNSSDAIVQTSNGTIISLEQTNPEQVSDGEASWRQLQ